MHNTYIIKKEGAPSFFYLHKFRITSAFPNLIAHY